MKTINDIIDEIIKLSDCENLKGRWDCEGCWDCDNYSFCHVDTMFIALDYIDRKGTI